MPDDERPPQEPCGEEELASMVWLARCLCAGAPHPRVAVNTLILALARTVVHLADAK